MLTEYTIRAIRTDAERAARLGLHPIKACYYNHREHPDEHRLWMDTYQATKERLDVSH